jgi:integrase
MQKALNEKLHNNREFDYFAGTSEDTFMIYLTRDEIDKIADLELSDDTLKQVRDAFIVLCETALRVSDYKKVDFNIRSKGSQKLIYLNQTKTGDQVVIPLSTRLEKILLKYNYKLPVLSDQKINFNIKIIARSAGITEIINLEKTKYGKKYQIQKEKCSLVTCHTARRSAATNMFLAGIPAISIMKITGHKSEKSFMRYIRISAEENAVKLYDHPYYSGLKVAK